MCCDKHPDRKNDYEYLVLLVNNESRDSRDQHATHVHDDAEGGCSHGDGLCADLHLLKWKFDEEGNQTCLAQDICKWMDERIEKGGKILVHGYDGVTNSTAVVVAYLMWKEKLRLKDAVEKVASKRPIIRLTNTIMRDLGIWDTRLVLERTDMKNRRIIPQRGTSKKQNRNKK
jgi:hypothetical protein